MPFDPDAAEEWLEFNVSVRRAGEQKGRLSFLSRGGLERDGVDPLSLATLERGGDAGRLRGSRQEALERDGDCPAGSRGVRMGRTMYLDRGLDFFESFPFLWIGRRL